VSKVQVLIAQFNDHGERRPMAAAAKIARLGRAAVPELIAALQSSPNVRIRRWSAYALRLIRDARVAAPLKKAINDLNMSVRLLAMESLESVVGAKAGKHILPLLKDESGGVRVRAIDCLARLKYTPAVRALTRALKDEKWYVRDGAARALERICGKKRLRLDDGRGGLVSCKTYC
jgi:HEAT repeat protein